jgi:3-hydroxyisobutyrate dehydrogenase-like beta-hydroxyacid dehydrogenase
MDRSGGHGCWYGSGEWQTSGSALILQSLLQQGFTVQAYDVWAPSLESAVKAGAIPCSTPALAAKGANVLALMVVNAAQVEDVLFGTGNVAQSRSRGEGTAHT